MGAVVTERGWLWLWPYYAIVRMGTNSNVTSVPRFRMPVGSCRPWTSIPKHRMFLPCQPAPCPAMRLGVSHENRTGRHVACSRLSHYSPQQPQAARSQEAAPIVSTDTMYVVTPLGRSRLSVLIRPRLLATTGVFWSSRRGGTCIPGCVGLMHSCPPGGFISPPLRHESFLISLRPQLTTLRLQLVRHEFC